MTNPFERRVSALSGPARDIVPVVPSDTTDLPEVAVALYAETGGAVTLTTVRGQLRTVQVADYSILPVGTARVHATGTTAEGLHAMMVRA